MAKKIFTVYRLDQLKEHTTNMFQQCGGSGGVSENVKEIPEPPYHYSPRVAELKICTLESTYRNASNIGGPRHCVSESNLFMHRDADWFRQPRSLAYGSGDPRSASRDFDYVSDRYPAAESGRADTVTTRVQTPGSVLVRFKTFLGMDGSAQKLEIITDGADFESNNVATPDENGIVRMKTLFATRGSAPDVQNNSSNTISERIGRVKSLIKTKRPKINVDAAEIRKDPAERIVRMKTLFGNRTPENVLQIESQIATNKPKGNLGRIKTLFSADASSQTDDVTPSSDVEPPRGKRFFLKNLMGFEERSPDDTVAKAVDDRQVFSRQSTPPTRADEQVPARRRPVWLDNLVRRVRASVAGARVNDVEIPDIAVEPQPDVGGRKPGSTSGWQWRHGAEVQQAPEKRSGFKSWFGCETRDVPSCPFPKTSLVRNTSPKDPYSFVEVIALICGVLVVVLMALGLASADWLMAAGWRQGLFSHCVEEGAPTPLPFNLVELPGCYASRDVGYIRAAAALCIVTLCADVVGSLLTALGLRATDHRTKYKYYRLAVLAMALALISILIALVIYPVCFAAELNLGNRTVWEFGWAYGVGWGAAIFLFGAVILLLCDKESEEIYYKERKVEREPPGGGP